MLRHLSVQLCIASLSVVFSASSARSEGDINCYARLSRALVNKVVSRDINRVDPIDRIVLGVHFRGSGYATGKVKAQLVPSSNCILVDIVSQGRIFGQAIGRPSDADLSVFTDTFSTFSAVKRIQLDPRGVGGYSPSSDVHTISSLRDIKPDSRGPLGEIGRNLAEARFERDKSLGEAISSDLTSERINMQFDREIVPQLQQAGKAYQRLRRALGDRGLRLDHVRYATSAEAIFAAASLSDGSKVVASRPLFGLRSDDLTVSVHESLLNQILANYFAGKTYSVEKLRKQVGKMVEKFGRDFFPTELPEGIVVQFAAKQPFTFRFSEDRLELKFTVQSIRIEDFDLGGATVKIAYRLQRGNGPIALIRHGGVEVDAESNQVRQALKEAFRRALPLRLNLGVLELEGLLARLGRLTASDVQTRRGWLLLTFRSN